MDVRVVMGSMNDILEDCDSSNHVLSKLSLMYSHY